MELFPATYPELFMKFLNFMIIRVILVLTPCLV